jgi:hypothetical protein
MALRSIVQLIILATIRKLMFKILSDYKVNLKIPLTFRIKTDTQSFKPNTNFIAREKITTIIMIDTGVTIRIFSITFNTGRLFEKEEESSP